MAGAARRVLLVDDRAPRAAAGSGFPRTLDLLRDLAARPDLTVAVLPTIAADVTAESGVAALGVEVLRGDFEEQLVGFAPDLVVLSRPHNAHRAIPLVRARCPHTVVVVDVEALVHRRLQQEADVVGDPARRERLAAEVDRVAEMERDIVRGADLVVCLSVDEREWIEGVEGHPPVAFVPPWSPSIELQPPDWRSRRGALFAAGWSAGADSPNGDGLVWLVEEVLPEVARRAPELVVDVTGADPPDTLRTLATPSLRFVGALGDMAAAHGRARVAVAPVRYGAGVKLKVMEAIQAGTPVVTTSVGAEGFTDELRDAIVVVDEPVAFGAAVARLAVDRRAWFEQRLCIELARRRALAAGMPTVAAAILDALDRRPAHASR